MLDCPILAQVWRYGSPHTGMEITIFILPLLHSRTCRQQARKGEIECLRQLHMVRYPVSLSMLNAEACEADKPKVRGLDSVSPQIFDSAYDLFLDMAVSILAEWDGRILLTAPYL